MAKFRVPSSNKTTAESPVLLFRDLRKDPSIKFLWGHQEKLLDDYHKNFLGAKDLAVELPTGAGKTLVGLLIAEYRRKSKNERVAFVCPTRQLCYQVKNQAEKYGIKVSTLVGAQKDYPDSEFMSYQRADSIAITTYKGIFNSNPRLDDPNVLIFDDAHAADNYIASMWTLKISRYKYEEIFLSLIDIFRESIPGIMHYFIESFGEIPVDFSRVDMLSSIILQLNKTKLNRVLNAGCADTELSYPWGLISSHLDACNMYVSADSIEIRPYIPPTLTHAPFANASQRVYMSATLGEDGDIERVFGVEKINRLPMPAGWDKRGIGRRFILFPTLSPINQNEVQKSVLELAKKSLYLVPDNTQKEEIKKKLKKWDYQILEAGDIEADLNEFIRSDERMVLLIANRYDGIDLPGDACRSLILSGMPSGSGLQEKFLILRLGAKSQFRDRIRTRITQALGRCTRDESDYSLVLVLGNDLVKWFCTLTNTQGMHPEIQAEIAFGLENSKDFSKDDLIELIENFMAQDEEWVQAESAIKEIRNDSDKKKDAVSSVLQRSAPLEVQYIYQSWGSSHNKALVQAASIIDTLSGGRELKPYRAFWHHQAAVSAFYLWKQTKDENYKSKAKAELERVTELAMGIQCLEEVKYQIGVNKSKQVQPAFPVTEWYSELENALNDWGIMGTKFDKYATQLTACILSKEANKFENGLYILGKILGAMTHRWESDGAPDGLWCFSDYHAFVFEAKTDESADSPISLATVRQAASHEARVRDDKLIPKSLPCTTVLISPRSSIDRHAVPASKNIKYISHNDIILLFNHALEAFREVRSTASSLSDEELVLSAERFFRSKSVFPDNILQEVFFKNLNELPAK